MKARETVMEQLQAIAMQAQSQQLQPQQFAPEQVEAQVAVVEAELMADIMPRLAAGQDSAAEDPLVKIRMQGASDQTDGSGAQGCYGSG